MTLKTLKFHKISLFTFKNNSDPTSAQSPLKVKNIKESRTIIHDIVEGIQSRNYGIYSYDNGKSRDTIEFLNSNKFLDDKSKGILFGKISKVKDHHNYQKRKVHTNKEIKIIQSNDEIFESRTFFILDTSNLVLSYISEQGSPSIRSIEKFFSSFTEKSSKYMTIRCEVKDIMSKESIESIAKNEYVGDVKYVMEIPDSFSELDVPLKPKAYKRLHNQSKMEVIIKQKAVKRGTPIFGTKDTISDKINYFNMINKIPGIKSIFAKTKEKKTDRVREVVVGEKNPFILKVNFDFNNSDDDNYVENICKRIVSEYNNLKDKINSRIRNK